MTQELKPASEELIDWPKAKPEATTGWFRTDGTLFIGTIRGSAILFLPPERVKKLIELAQKVLGKPQTLAQELHQAEEEAARLGEKAFQSEAMWKLEEARARLKQKAKNENAGKRWSSKDIDSQVIIIQANQKNPLGKAWIEMCQDRALAAEAKVMARALSRKHYEETKRW